MRTHPGPSEDEKESPLGPAVQPESVEVDAAEEEEKNWIPGNPGFKRHRITGKLRTLDHVAGEKPG